ncbi:putative cystathionine gamma-synthase [Smittium mucronatum]|uniref:Putative cystathionine gamma-synthase n=1 Tax=Smittium mucronatum TaxID=133383 RepID=A0A1R0GUQ4_9FUNG|nr:putative cystathionine gamma-synthase [Smittium mucronatum]
MREIEFGSPIPEHAPFAISVSLPKWQDNINYEEGLPSAINAMKSGYPRFFIAKNIRKLTSLIEKELNLEPSSLLIFPSKKCAKRCKQFILEKECLPNHDAVRVQEYFIDAEESFSASQNYEPKLFRSTSIFLTIFDPSLYKTGKRYWQHTGEGISSRLAEYCLFFVNLRISKLLNEKKPSAVTESANFSVVDPIACSIKTPSYYKKPCMLVDNYSPRTLPPPNTSLDSESELAGAESSRFIEERYGGNLNSFYAEEAKLMLRKRISGILTESDLTKYPEQDIRDELVDRGIRSLSENDVFLTSTGMGAIFSTHRIILETIMSGKSVCFGFPYTDTIKILENFGPGMHFLGIGEGPDYTKLELLLENATDPIVALFTETPSNPLLKTPDLQRLRHLADKYNFILVVDDSIGNFVNVDTLSLADVVVSSLTKLFSGDSNVMGGSIVLNPDGRNYEKLKAGFNSFLEDLLWWEDAIFLERNSRNFLSRTRKINCNAELVFSLLSKNKNVSKIYYPKVTCSELYEKIKRKSPDAGYGGLISLVFNTADQARIFYDNLACSKGPSLGTNFTLASPYAILAHYNELDWAAQYGIDRDLIRISVGMESQEELLKIFQSALDTIE